MSDFGGSDNEEIKFDQYFKMEGEGSEEFSIHDNDDELELSKSQPPTAQKSAAAGRTPNSGLKPMPMQQ